MAETRNILLIGRTGEGKSTLANVLVNKNGNFSEVFKSSGSSVSTTAITQTKEVKMGGINYRIIDTVGLGDTRMKIPQVAKKLAESFQTTGGKINQIFLVMGDRFTKENYESFYLLKELDPEILKYTTIIRTRFVEFNNLEECQKSDDILKDPTKVNEEIVEIANSVPIVRVDNPPVKHFVSKKSNETDKEFQERKKRRKEDAEWGRAKRTTSRQKIFSHLQNYQETYQLNMDNL